jgi:hypothetical protein
MSVLSQASGVAAVILAIEIFAIGLAVLAVLYLAVRAMGRLLPKVRLWLRIGAGWLAQVEAMVITLMQWLLAPILFLASLWAGVGEGVRALRRR